jgi:predicted transcriptional regulator
MEMQTHEFLNLYKMIEDTLEERYARQGRRYSSVIMEFINSPEGEAWREQMDMCREIRNLMTHTADIGGEAIVTPAAGVVEILREILEYVEKPPMAIDYATKAAQILKVSPMDFVLPVMKAMQRRGISHVPVMQGDKVAGVFSVGTIFSEAIGGGRVDEKTRVKDFAHLLPVEDHVFEQFAFIGEHTTLPEAQAAFDRRDKKRMAALFVTRGGGKDGALLRMITPWDVLRQK